MIDAVLPVPVPWQSETRQSEAVALRPARRLVRRVDLPEARAKATAMTDGGEAGVMSGLLVAVAERRDRDAFEALFRHFGPRVKSFLVKQGAERGQAEELMQETMVAVWRKAEQFDPKKASASTWIFTIARNLRIDAFRRTRRPELDPEDPALVPDAPDTPDALFDAQQSADRVRAALASLSQQDQTLLKLSFSEDKSHAVIAAELGLPLGTVKSRLRLAFGKIRKSLDNNLVTPAGTGGFE